MENKKDFSPSPQDAECIGVPVRLDRATYDFCKELIDGTDVPIDECLAFLIRSEFHRYLIGLRLTGLGLSLVTEIPGVTAFTPVPQFLLEPSFKYIDSVLVPKTEVSSDG